MKPANAGADWSGSVQGWLRYGVIALLIMMPFHATATIVAGHVFGYQAIFQAWKEVLLLAMMAAVVVLWLSKGEFPLQLSRANQVAIAIIVLGLGISALHYTGLQPFLFGVKSTLLPLVVYLVVQVAKRIPAAILHKLILWPSYVVAALALLQEFVLPPSLLTAIGYGATTIQPIQLVDPAVKSIRAFATLGGPNQLGAYLILPTIFGVAIAWRNKKLSYAIGVSLTTAGLVVSFSRSAWLGLVVASVVLIFLLGNKLVRWLMAAAAVLVAVAYITLSASLPTQLKNTQLQYYLLHGRYNDEQMVEGSDVARNRAQAKGIETIRQHPLGLGLGSAGPASFQSSQPLITENWYSQVAIELGLIGLALYLIFFGLSFWQMVQLGSPLGLALGASLVGLAVTGLFLHVWADSTLGLTFFALLGITAAEKQK